MSGYIKASSEVYREAILESGTKVYYKDVTLSLLLKRVEMV